MIEPSADLRQQLHTLPDVPLPDTLWQRVEAGRRRKIRRRKLGVGVASLALAAVMAAPLLFLMPGSDQSARGKQEVVQQPVDGEKDVQADLRALDLALQAAYDRGASDAEIAPMWVARDALFAGIRSGSPAPRRNPI